MNGYELIVDVARMDDDPLRTLRRRQPPAHYWLAGVWERTTHGARIVWSSEPVSYPTRRAALVAARKMRDTLLDNT